MSFGSASSLQLLRHTFISGVYDETSVMSETVVNVPSANGPAYYTRRSVKPGHYPFSISTAAKTRVGIQISVGKKGVLSDAEVLDLHNALINWFDVIAQAPPGIQLSYLEAIQYLLMVNSGSIANVDTFGGVEMPEIVISVPAQEGQTGSAVLDEHGEVNRVGPAYDAGRPLPYATGDDGQFVPWRLDSRVVLETIGAKGHAYMRAVASSLVALADAALAAYSKYGENDPLGSIGSRLHQNALEMGIPGLERYAFVNSIYVAGISPSVYASLQKAKRDVLSRASDSRGAFHTAASSGGGGVAGVKIG